MKFDAFVTYEQMQLAIHERAHGRGKNIDTATMLTSLGLLPDAASQLAEDAGKRLAQETGKEPMSESLAVAFLMGLELGAMLEEVAIRIQLAKDGKSMDQ